MPTLAVANISLPPTWNGERSASVTFSASARASARPATAGTTMANSSPPMRPTVPLPSTTAPSTPATWRNRSSPALWPAVSFTTLKLSRSISSSASRPPSAPRSAIASSSRP
nr:hypothetical protein [Massilia sp. Root351]